MRTEGAEVLVGATIETVAAVEKIERILSVPELDFVFIGPLDLSVSLGRPGEYEEMREAVETVRAAAIVGRLRRGAALERSAARVYVSRLRGGAKGG